MVLGHPEVVSMLVMIARVMSSFMMANRRGIKNTRIKMSILVIPECRVFEVIFSSHEIGS